MAEALLAKDRPFYYLNGRPHVIQDLGNLTDIFASVPETQDKLVEAGQDIARYLGGDLIIGDPKDQEVAKAKVLSELQRKETLMSDACRFTCVVDDIEQVQQGKALFDPTKPTSDILAKHGIIVVLQRDYFEEPKYETGWRCINARLGIPIGEYDGETIYHYVEGQISGRALHDVYNLTHHHMRTAQNITAKYVDIDMPNSEAIRRFSHYQVCKYINGSTAKMAGYDVMIKDSLTNPQNSIYGLANSDLESIQDYMSGFYKKMNNRQGTDPVPARAAKIFMDSFNI